VTVERKKNNQFLKKKLGGKTKGPKKLNIGKEWNVYSSQRYKD